MTIVLLTEGNALGAVGIFLSGAGSILGALGAIHYERKRGEKECDKRFADFMRGMEIRDEMGRKDETSDGEIEGGSLHDG